MSSQVIDNKRIAKNTVFLYIRTLVVMVIALYTSRIVLRELGVEDYGIYQLIGGFVAMFAVISSALSTAISRFITFEIGHGDLEKLKKIFSTSVNIQIVIALIIVVFAEILGIWFINNKMQIPIGRESATLWVLHFSILAFCINLISIPYNACIIAHEHMKAFAYFSLFEAFLKLAVCYLIIISPIDALIWYSLLLVIVALIIRIMYALYCHRRFEESVYHFLYDKKIFKEMANFAGWSFFSNAVYILNTQGVGVLMNVYFGVTLNAARGIATQVDQAVLQFANNFTTAINPQITKSYAVKEYGPMYVLICRGARFSYYLLLLLAIPIFLEIDQVLAIWLTVVPDHTANFVRLALIATIITALGNTGTTACLATGEIKGYVLWLSSVGLLAFPLAWVCFQLGFQPEIAYITYILVYSMVDVVRLFLMKQMLRFPISLFVKDVILRIVPVTILALIAPVLVYYYLPQSLLRMILTITVSLFSTSLAVITCGMSREEKFAIRNKIVEKLCH